MLSKSSKYALKAVLYLTLHSSEEKKINVKDIAKPINVPQAYIAKILQILSKKNLISSTRGPKGGFYLNKNNRKQSVLNIIYAIDGEKKLTSCLLSLDKCNESKPCPLHDLANASRIILLKNFQTKTLNDLSSELINKKSFLPL